MNLLVTPEAQTDIREALGWLGERSPELPGRFQSVLDAAFNSVIDRPEMYPLVYRNFRRALTKTFPFGIFYTAEGGNVIVFAVIHHARDPRIWQRRA